MINNKEKEGIVFDIERFSTKDGPGIRTVVFLKGCNMECYWCHNYEGISREPQLQYDANKCIGCMECFRVCSQKAHIIIENKHILDRTRCITCFKCARVCYTGALEKVGKKVTVDELVNEIIEDEPFYRNSGGGVTFSGGEIMCQSDFVVKILFECRKKGIHTAVETNMSFPWENYRQMLPLLDLVLTDIKVMNEKAHIESTGISNKNILENIRRLGKTGIPFIVRTPIIPGFNDTEDNILATARFLKKYSSLLYYELLSYNPLGEMKPALLGVTGKNRQIRVPFRESLKSLGNVVLNNNIKLCIDGRFLSKQKLSQ